MKNQYFGDINDYRMYGLLRVLYSSIRIPTTLAWMLTPDDGQPEGGKISYLNHPEIWRGYDRELYDFLREVVVVRSSRDIREIEQSGLLGKCRFHSQYLKSDRSSRESYFERLWQEAGSEGLIFFDPDNGFEVSSLKRESSAAPKYLFWSEFREGYRRDHSLLVFQHLRRNQRADVMISDLAQRCIEEAKAPWVAILWASPVVYFLVPQPAHAARLESASRLVADVWRNQITWWKVEAR